MRKRWLILGSIAVATVTVISQLPLSLVAPKAEFAGKPLKYRGTIWNGQVSGTDAGVLNLDTSLWRFVTGDNPVHVKGGPSGLEIEIEVGLGGLRAVQVEGSMKTLALRDPRIGAVNGNFRLNIPDMKLLEVCEYADGTAWTDFLSQNSATLRWKGPPLEGPVRCENGFILVDLAGQDRHRTPSRSREPGRRLEVPSALPITHLAEWRPQIVCRRLMYRPGCRTW